MKKTCVGIVSMALIAVSASATLITDAVDNDGVWSSIGGGFFTASGGGLTPVAGAQFFTAANAGGSTRGTQKTFTDVYVAETLQVSYSVGDRTDWTFKNPQGFLWADTDGDGYQWTDRILPTTVVSHTEPLSGWETWIDIYTIDASTTTAGGASVLGENIAFFVANQVASGAAVAFDALTIQTIPEPATLGFLSMGTLGLLSVRRLFRL